MNTPMLHLSLKRACTSFGFSAIRRHHGVKKKNFPMEADRSLYLVNAIDGSPYVNNIAGSCTSRLSLTGKVTINVLIFRW